MSGFPQYGSFSGNAIPAAGSLSADGTLGPRTRRAGLVAAVLIAAGACACGDSSPAVREYVFEGPAMGTTFQVKVAGRGWSADREDEIRRAIASELDDVNQKMSTYLASSEISRFNRAETTRPLVVSSETIEVLLEAARISAATGGAFDITVGPLVEAWGFGPAGEAGPAPDEETIQRLLGRVGWHKIKVNERENTVRKLAPDIECDLSAIAKGYAVDRIAAALSRRGPRAYMIEVGGEIRCAGQNTAGEPWRIAIERPMAGSRQTQRVLALRDIAMASSGDYRNFIEKDGVRYSHTIDPRSGRPAMHRLAAVSVLDASCMRADAYATALMVMGEKEGLRFAESSGLLALFLIRTASGEITEVMTAAFRERFGGDGPGSRAAGRSAEED